MTRARGLPHRPPNGYGCGVTGTKDAVTILSVRAVCGACGRSSIFQVSDCCSWDYHHQPSAQFWGMHQAPEYVDAQVEYLGNRFVVPIQVAAA